MSIQVNRLITHRNASTLGWTGLGFSLIAFPVTGWAGVVLATAGLLLCLVSLIARFYLNGYMKGERDTEARILKELRTPITFTGPVFQVKTFREGADK